MHELSAFTGSADTLVEVLRTRAAHEPEREALVFLRDGEGDAVSWSYGDLGSKAARIASALATRAGPGERVMLLYPPGPEMFAALFGSFMAGTIAVPAYPPDPARLDQTLSRLVAITRDAGATLACSTSMGCSLGSALPGIDLTWVATDALDEGGGAAAQRISEQSGTDPGSEDIAILQYTSGSTGDPKGVRVSHANILANLALIHEGVQQDRGGCAVLWLPPYHDMGLLNTLYAVAVGFRCVTMSPLHFLHRPARWLSAISRHRATYSGGPNFAYDLCVRRVRDTAGLDLSSWQVAFNGAEPVRRDTLRRFSAAFAEAGFRPEAHYPCYGLAEATVAVSGGTVAGGARTLWLSREALSRGAVERIPEGAPNGTAVVGCGRTQSRHRLRIVDPERRVRLPSDRIGEIWVAGPSVACGYHGRAGESREVFTADLGEDRGYLRTGDLGFIDGDELFVVGRLKDVIILRGKNHHPPDLERTIEQWVTAIRPGCTAAIAAQRHGEEGLVILAEVGRRGDAPLPAPALAAVTERVKNALAAEHGLAAIDVRLLPPGRLPKTSSGKLRRALCRRLYHSGAFA